MAHRAPTLAAELRRVGLAAGLDGLGVTSAAPFVEARAALEERRAAGLHGGMQFTYRNPARSTEPSRALPGARSLVVGALGYHLGAPPVVAVADRPAGRVARYAWEDFYGRLRGALDDVAAVLRARGHRAVVLADDNALVDRAAAVRAGLGWYGNNTTVLVPGVGSWCVLGSVVTDAALTDTPQARPGGCGTCRRCLPACPTGALVAPGVLDARRCLAWVVQAPGSIPRQLREAVGDRMYGCDDCQDACPVNRVTLRRSRRKAPPELPATPSGTGPAPAAAVAPDEEAAASVDVLALLAASDDELLARWGRWYIAERNPRYLRRNALVVLGNTADGADPAVAAALGAALGSADPLLRAHATWAAARLGRHDLLAAVAADDDPQVLAELADLPAPRPGARPAVPPAGGR